MTEGQIRQMIQQEIAKSNQRNSFNLNATPIHRHTGKGQDGPQINQSDIIPGQTSRGLITFAQSTTYTIGIKFNPTSLFVYGVASHKTAGTIDIRAFIIGDAKFAPSFYFQPASTTSVVTGGTLLTGNPPGTISAPTIIQSSAYFGITGSGSGNGSAVHALADQFRLVDVEYPTQGSIVARATVISATASAIKIQVSLASGWQIDANYIIT